MTQTKTNTTHTNINTKTMINWGEYNKALKNRGNLSIYISESVARGALITPRKAHKPGRPKVYSDALIELILTIRELFRLPLRQSLGFAEFIFKTMNLTVELPDYSTLSIRMDKLDVDYCRKFRGQNVVMLIDSSGFKVFGEGEWKVRKHGYSYRRTWRETHIAVDLKTRNIIGLINTKSGAGDCPQLKPLLNRVRQKHTIETIIGDGAYDAKTNYLLGRKLNIEMITPPKKTAVEHLNMCHYQSYDTPGWEERNAVVRHIEKWGLDGWKADVDYHRRSLVENTYYRLKTIFGDNLKSRKEGTQYAEQCIRASLINRFNAMGLPRYASVR